MSRAKGFTLIETLIAMVLLAGALIVLGNAWSGSLNAIRKSRSLTTLSLLLQRKMTEYEIKYKDKTTGEVPEEETGDFGSDFAPYTWKMQSRKIEMPDMSAALTARTGGATETEIMIVKQLQEMIEKSVKEMRVTVLWTTGEKVQEYSLTTYLVDHEGANVGGIPGAGGAGGGGTTGGKTTGNTAGGTGQGTTT
jgi:prepilin-type N-terminal cleavage/methylation domain-containing protein